jgi:hypothetical protein
MPRPPYMHARCRSAGSRQARLVVPREKVWAMKEPGTLESGDFDARQFGEILYSAPRQCSMLLGSLSPKTSSILYGREGGPL